MTNRKNFLYVCKVLLGLILLAWLLGRIDYRQIYASLGSGDPVFLIFGVIAMSLAFIVVQGIRLHILIRSITTSRIEALKIVLISLFLDQFLPSNMGGDAYRIIYLLNIGNSTWAKPVTLIFIDRFVGMITMFFAGMIYLFMRGNLLFSKIGTVHSVKLSGLHLSEWLAFGVILTLIMGLFARSKIKNWWKKLVKFLIECTTVTKAIELPVWLGLIFLSICFHALRATGFYFFLRYFNEYVHLLDLVFVLFFTAFVSIVPVTIGGLGVIEGVTAFSLSIFGVAGSTAVAIAFLNRLVWIAYGAVGGLWFVLGRKNKKTPQVLGNC
jgi:glycosyltransferase 2 family protein